MTFNPVRPFRSDPATDAVAIVASAETCVRVDAPSRLHLGFLDPNASLGRRFASLGLVIDAFATRLEIAAAPETRVWSDDPCQHDAVRRLARHLDTLQRETGLRQPLQVRLRSAPPAHSGFGSGTQLALALGRAFCALHGLELSTRRLAAMLGRGERSGVGIAGFDQGGLLLDGGPGPGGTPAPVLARLDFPAAWRVLLVLDERIDGLSGAAERAAMDQLAPFPRELAADLCHQVLLKVLPAVIEQRFEPFAEGVSRIQSQIGDYFAPAQGGSMYTSAAVAACMDWLRAQGPAGVGQSSWGPTGFAILPSAEVAQGLIARGRAQGAIDPALRLVVCGGDNRGARIGTVSAAQA
ncbi:MAG: beta-ribofuranosylaminobenzene 5'-phosphate synthase family protein [Thauera sp.]